MMCLTLAVSVFADERVDKLTEDFRIWLEEEVVYIITYKERDVFLNLETQEERRYFVEAFWRRRDPNSATVENEFKKEHYRRIEHANHWFGREAPMPGWKTDRGKYYIILGEPYEVQDYEGHVDVNACQLWIYNGDVSLGVPPRIGLVFYKKYNVGEFQLYHPIADGPNRLLKFGAFYHADDPMQAVDTLELVSMDLAKASLTVDMTEQLNFLSGRLTRDMGMLQGPRPSIQSDLIIAAIDESPQHAFPSDYADEYLRHGKKVSAEYSFNFVPNRSYFTVLAGPKSTPFVHYSLELNPESFSLQANEDGTRFQTTLEISMEIKDMEGNLVALNDNIVPLELTASQVEAVQSFPFAYQDNFPIMPGEYQINIILRNRATKQYTVAERQLRVEPVTGKPMLSDIILGYQNELVSGNAGPQTHLTFQLGAERIHPAMDGAFPIGETMHVFTQTEGAAPDYGLRFALLDGDEVLQEKKTEVGDYFDGPAIEDFSLLGMKGGNYSVQVELTDPTGQVMDKKSTLFVVTPRSWVPRAGFIYRRGFNTETPGLLSLARGQQLLAQSRVDEARAELEAAVAAKNPQLPMANWKLAGLLLYSREADRALELLLPLKDDYPDEYEVVEGLGFAYFFKEDFAQAAAYLEKAMGIRAPDPSVLNALGISCQQLGRREDAKNLFEHSLELNPAQTGVKKRLELLREGGSQ